MGLFTRIKDWDDGDVLTEPDLEAEFDNIYDSVVAGTTAEVGMVQLEDSHASTSVTKAACPKNVKEAYDLANGLVSDTGYGAGWNGITDIAPSKNAVYDKIETLGGGGGLDWSLINTNTNAIAAHGYLINASAAAITLTLPGSPSTGDAVGVCDIYNKATTNTITIDRNTKNIESGAENLIVDIDGAGFTLVFTDATRGWEIVTEIGSTGGGGTVDTFGAPVDNDFAKFTDANTIEGRSKTEMLSDLNVEDGATADNISDANVTDLTDGFDTTLHDHDGISENTNARHTQGTDTGLGTMTADINMGTHKITALSAPSAAGHSLRATASITETAMEDAITKKHAATLIGTKTIDETDIANTKVIAYNSTSGNLEYEAAGTPDAHAATHITGGGDTIANAVAAGNAGLMTGADKTKLNGIEAAADVTDVINVNAAGAVMESDYNANTFLYAVSDDTPVVKTRAETLALLSGQAAASFDMNSQAITKLSNIVTTHTPGAAGTATLDLDVSRIHDITMPAGNITIAISNENNGDIFTIRILQDGTGNRTVTWFSTIKWAGGSAPTLTTTANKADTVIFRVTGTDTYDGFVVGKNV